ncbi:MAG: metal-dependent transcriptional regulator [Lachnospiraceae bacterium]|nr:metal-dependent transcriptional regulator [Lachnospiraceae bacterium]
MEKINKSAEDYIKTIYLLEDRIGCVRSVDIAREMSYSKASVSVAMSNLRRNNIISMKKNGQIKLTREGIKAAREICEKHSTLSVFLKTVANVDEKTAKEDACWIGHYLSPSTYAGIKKYIQSLQTKGVIGNELE